MLKDYLEEDSESFKNCKFNPKTILELFSVNPSVTKFLIPKLASQEDFKEYPLRPI